MGRFQEVVATQQTDVEVNKQIQNSQQSATLAVARESAPLKLTPVLEKMKPEEVRALQTAALADNATRFRDILKPYFPKDNDHAQFPSYRVWFKSNDEEIRRQQLQILGVDAEKAIAKNAADAPAKFQAYMAVGTQQGLSPEALTENMIKIGAAREKTSNDAYAEKYSSNILKAASGLDEETIGRIMKYLDRQYNTDYYAQIISNSNKGIPAEIRAKRNEFIDQLREELNKFEKAAQGNGTLLANIEVIREGINQPKEADAIDAALKEHYTNRVALNMLDGPEHARLLSIVPRKK